MQSYSELTPPIIYSDGLFPDIDMRPVPLPLSLVIIWLGATLTISGLLQARILKQYRLPIRWHVAAYIVIAPVFVLGAAVINELLTVLSFESVAEGYESGLVLSVLIIVVVQMIASMEIKNPLSHFLLPLVAVCACLGSVFLAREMRSAMAPEIPATSPVAVTLSAAIFGIIYGSLMGFAYYSVLKERIVPVSTSMTSENMNMRQLIKDPTWNSAIITFTYLFFMVASINPATARITPFLMRYKLGVRDFSNAKLRGAVISDMKLQYVDFSGADLQEAQFVGVEFWNTSFSNANLKDAVLEDVMLNWTEFKSADLRGATIEITNSNVTDSGWVAPLEIKLYNVALHNAIIDETTRVSSDFILAWELATNGGSKRDLRDIFLPGVNLVGIDLSGADLRGADLTLAILIDVDLTGANLSKAKLRSAWLNRAILQGADLREADLSSAVLINANLRDADLRGADLSAFHYRANSASLCGADLTNANLRNAEVAEYWLDADDEYWQNDGFSELFRTCDEPPVVKDAIMPDGTKHP